MIGAVGPKRMFLIKSIVAYKLYDRGVSGKVRYGHILLVFGLIEGT